MHIISYLSDHYVTAVPSPLSVLAGMLASEQLDRCWLMATMELLRH